MVILSAAKRRFCHLGGYDVPRATSRLSAAHGHIFRGHDVDVPWQKIIFVPAWKYKHGSEHDRARADEA